MNKNVVYLLAIIVVTIAASTGIVMAKQYQASQTASAPENGPPQALSCPCRESGLDCDCTDKGQPCGCGQNGQKCACSSACHQAKEQDSTTE